MDQHEAASDAPANDPFHHLHDEDYAAAYARPRVGAAELVIMSGRNGLSLNGLWDFTLDLFDEGLRQRWFEGDDRPSTQWPIPRDYDGGGWQQITVPSCWNLQRPEWYFFEGAAWYGRTLELAAVAPGERLVLHIGAAASSALVFLNGQFCGGHRGASTPFCIDLTAQAQAGSNRLLIQVENRRRADGVPMHHFDWFNYGGLFRDVTLLHVPAISIAEMRIALVPDGRMNRIHAALRLSLAVSGQAELSIEGLDGPLDGPWLIDVQEGHGALTFDAAPRLWSPDSPKLYHITLRFGEDVLQDRIGFRDIRVEGERLLLNGEDLTLRGICVHEDDRAVGRVCDDADLRRRFTDAKALGCNFLRLSHYPHHHRAAEIADEMGLLLWEEIPVYWAIDFANPATLADAQNQLNELIKRDINRASVIIWGVGNENADTDARLAFMRTLAESARTQDPTRLISAACLINRQNFTIEDRLAEHLDIIGINEYFGWYEPGFDGLRRLLAHSQPGKPVIITETGADGVPGLGEDDLFSEARQADFYRGQLALIETASYVRGFCPWILYDFRSERRQTRHHRGWNMKGLIAADKTTRKPAFDVLAAYYHQRGSDLAAIPPPVITL
jgi:beta-glucuronidase